MYPCDSELLAKILTLSGIIIEFLTLSGRSAVRFELQNTMMKVDLDIEVTTLEFPFKGISTGKNSQSNGPWMMLAWASTTTCCQYLERSSLGQDWEVTHV